MGFDLVATGKGLKGDLDKSPGKQGYGLENPGGQYTGYKPHQTGGGLTAGQDPYAGQRFGQAPQGGQTQAPTGWDMSSPGVAEQYWQQQQGRYTQPGATQQQWGNAQGQYGRQGQAEAHWDQIKGGVGQPTYSEQTMKDPGLGGYYDRAKQRTLGSMNDQLAARGVYGTSAGADQVGMALTDLESQRANREADYALRQAGQADQARNAQMSTFGGLAQGAQGAMLNRLNSGMNAAGMADSSDLARLAQGMNAAATSQGLRRQRAQDYMQNLYAPTQGLMGMNMGGLGQMIGADQDLFGSILASALGQGQSAYGMAERDAQEHRGDMKMIMEMIGSFMGGGKMPAGKK